MSKHDTEKTREELINEIMVLRSQTEDLQRALNVAEIRDLSKRERLLLAVAEQAPISIWASRCKDGNFEISLWNEGAAHIYGHNQAKAVGSSYLDLIVSDEEREESATDCDAILCGKVFRNFIAFDLAEDGTRRAMLTNCFRIWDKEEHEYLQAEVALLVPELEPIIKEHQRIRESGIQELAEYATWTELLEWLHSIQQVINDSLEELTLNKALVELSEIVDSLVCKSENLDESSYVSSSICVFEDDSRDLTCIASTEQFQKKVDSDVKYSLVLSYIFEKNEPLFIDSEINLPSEFSQGNFGAFLENKEQALAFMPLSFANKVFGVLCLILEGRESFKAITLRGLKIVAEQIAMGIHVLKERERIGKLVARQQEMDTRGSIAFDFAHRINNLAGTIPGWVSLIRDRLFPADPRDEQLAKYLDKIESDVKGLIKEADRLQGPLEFEKVDVRLLIEGIVNRVRIVYPDIVVVDDFAEVDWRPVHALRVQLSNALWHIVDNALDAMGGFNGTLCIGVSNITSSGQDYLAISVKDTGQGISPEDVDRIFILGHTTKEKHSGYGLYQTKRVVEDLGGSITVESIVGVGTTFTIKLPTLNKQAVGGEQDGNFSE